MTRSNLANLVGCMAWLWNASPQPVNFPCPVKCAGPVVV